jgi:hypothetical protein
MLLSAITRRLVIASATLGGLSQVADRALVGTPGLRELGPEFWVQYSSHADLGTGLVLYPIAYIGWTALAVAAAITHRRGGRTPRRATVPIYLAAVCMLGVMALTAKAAPIMLGIGKLETEAEMQHAFDQFTFWGVYVRGALITVAFIASIWALAVLPPVTSRDEATAKTKASS